MILMYSTQNMYLSNERIVFPPKRRNRNWHSFSHLFNWQRDSFLVAYRPECDIVHSQLPNTEVGNGWGYIGVLISP